MSATRLRVLPPFHEMLLYRASRPTLSSSGMAQCVRRVSHPLLLLSFSRWSRISSLCGRWPRDLGEVLASTRRRAHQNPHFSIQEVVRKMPDNCMHGSRCFLKDQVGRIELRKSSANIFFPFRPSCLPLLRLPSPSPAAFNTRNKPTTTSSPHRSPNFPTRLCSLALGNSLAPRA